MTGQYVTPEALATLAAGMLESIRDGFVAVDADGIVLYVNRRAERFFGLPRERVLSTSIWQWVPKEPAQLETLLRATLADGRSRHLRRIQPQGAGFQNRFFDLWMRPLPGGGMAALFRNVTRRVRRERALARYAAEAEEANRAKSRFFAAISHEFRTPLNALVGYTYLLGTDTYGALPAPATRAAERAGVCAEHLARLIDDLLLMTTAEIDRLPIVAAPLRLEEFLRTSVEPLRQQAEAKGLRFDLTIAPELPTIETDADRLRQLLHALLSNAVKFTSRGGLGLEVSPISATDRAAPVGVSFRVRDSGPGIPDPDRQRIFEAFEQLGDSARSDSLQRGPGLGLTVARHLASLLGGELSLERSGPEGSVFRLELPLQASA